MFNGTAPAVRLPDFDHKQTLASGRLARLWRLMAGYQGLYAVAALSTGLAALANTAMFLVIRHFIDTYLSSDNSQPLTPLWLIIVTLLAFALGQGAFTFLARTLAAGTSEGIVVRLRNYIYDHIQRLPFRYHDKTQTGDLLQRATSDVDTVRRFFADQAIESGRISFLFLVNFAALLYLNRWLAVMSVIILPVVMVISIFFFKRIEKAYAKYQEEDSKLSSRLQENLTGVRVVKAFARQEYEIAKFDEVNQARFQRGKWLLLMHALFWPTTDIMCGAQMLGGYALAATMAIHGDITIGTYTAYVGLLGWIIWPLRNLGRLIVQMSESMVSLGRISEVLKQDREPLSEGNQALTQQVPVGELHFDHVHFQYEGTDRAALHEIDFHVAPGQSVALLGTTGSGKTSLVNLLPRFYDVSDGRILLDGVDLREYPRDFLRRNIGIVEQEPFLFSQTVRDNITYGVGRDVSMNEVEEVARAAAIHDVIVSKLPNGYNTLVGERGITLSGGQKQRVAIARTLLKDPRILILDDATSSVDTETEADIRSALRTLMKGRTTFIIAHRIQSVMDADQILVLDKGRIVQRGSHEALLAQAGPYRRIYEAQTKIESELEEELSHLG
ncbi:MAG: ABC transporter ATP-binding protein [Caldilineaceae bacterium]